jgi:site-specific DNA-methyltransferase (adenine-specific)
VEKFTLNNLSLYKAECLTYLKTLADDSVDLIATDPPYFRVKTNEWDNQWPTESAFFAWLDEVLVELARVLKPTGSLYLFCGPHLATKTELAVAKRFNVLNRIVWRKPSGRHLACRKESLRRYFPQTEHIIFAESAKPIGFGFEPIRSQLHQAIIDAGITQKQVDQACGNKMSGHWFGKSQWHMPSEQHYNTIKQLTGDRLPDYQVMYEQYRGLLDASNAARRTFKVTKQVPFTDVWDFNTVNFYPGKHPCEKPLDLMQHIVEASSLPGDVVLDAFVGSGSTAIACLDTGRSFIGCEMGDDEFEIAVERLSKKMSKTKPATPTS